MKYVIWGWAAVFDPDGHEVTDRTILSALSSFFDAEDLYQTDYIGGTEQEDAIAAALERSGHIRFALLPGEDRLRVRSTFFARRRLTGQELDCLRQDTLGQWSDGMGECLFVPDGPYRNYSLQPLDDHEAADPDYPFVEVIDG